MDCADCKHMKDIENSQGETIYICGNVDSAAYLDETGICGNCSSGEE